MSKERGSQEVSCPLREVTIKATTRDIWAIVDLIHDQAHLAELSVILAMDKGKKKEFRAKGLAWRELAGQIKRQLVDDINKEIDRQLDNRTNVSRETIDITARREK